MKKSKLIIDKHFIIDKVDRHIYGSFVEQLGRAVYEGIYQPDSPFANELGLREDVMKLVSELNVPIVRYPGGNFVSGFKWEDSIGPKDQRPYRVEEAWSTIESNQFGLNEFIEWCNKANTEPMMAVNLGTRGVSDAKNILEYCNFKGGTYWSDLRKKHGYENPHDIKVWCLGNEMDGDWQIGSKTAYEYGRIANETAKVMKMIDPDLQLVACGSSGRGMPTFGEWEMKVLELSYDNVDFISLHSYYGNQANDTADFLANTMDMDDYISSVIAICDAVKAKKKSKKQIKLSFDEWNVWYHTLESDEKLEKWIHAPHRLEDIYNFEDALLVGSMMITLLKHCDRIKMACLAQLVNVIAPIMTSDTGAWRQTIFYPFFYTSNYANGTVLNTLVKSPKYDSKNYTDVPYLDAVVVQNDEKDEVVLLAVNKDLEEDMEVTCDMRQFEGYDVKKHVVLYHSDLKAVNTEEKPNNVVPALISGASIDQGIFNVVLKKHSWNVVILGKV
ncbi:alpha-N-arabinofuranosidase [Herbivorax sp. ANBcel31]|uniref:arabinosylfuranosidase ArfA n=1 Tax=Herbivorax sp. ANBcel31 TaxID=3069754 RepID=UPI0027B405F8|nr:alpha-N-arabinofuranosidase [Herbivorax sp. ANBcel31]MDQ2087177.1 alpha-N-arabinofuranosidase [Herbivorax sp. ANBcel31]